MDANRWFPRAIWFGLLGALISVPCFYAVVAGAGHIGAALGALFDHHPWFAPVMAIVGSMAGTFSYLLCGRDKQSAPKR